MSQQKIDRYEIKQELGRGGMATVFEAYDPRFQRTVALKILPREFMHEPEFRKRFIREARTIAGLEHPAIVPVYDFGEDNGQPYLVMRLMPGGSLADRLQSGPLSIEETARILERLGSALDRAHSMGIIHRDMKPSNVLFDQYGDAYLADFGIVRVSTANDALTASGSLVGTPTYMSPEQVYGDKELDGRSDIYALGVILFQMLTGRTPYDADTPARMMMKHVMDPVPQILKVRPDLPPISDNIINKAMAKDRDARYKSALDLTKDLSRLSTSRTSRSDLQDELAQMQSDYTDVLEKTPLPGVMPEPKPTNPQRQYATPPPSQDFIAPSTPPPGPAQPLGTGSGTAGAFSPPDAQKSRPAWLVPVIGLIAVLCLGGVITLGVLAVRGDLGGMFAEATNTPRPDDDDEDDDPAEEVDEEATADAIAILEETAEAELALTETAEAAPPPTNTPEPPTAIPPAVDAEGTRASIAATRNAAATEPDTEAGEFTLSQDIIPLYGPFNGAIPHEEDNIIETVYADITPQNFAMQVIMGNPYGPETGTWDFGLIFRQAEADDELRLVVRSDGLWTLNDRSPGEDTFIQEGDVLDLLDLSPDGRNLFQMIALDNRGFFFLNNQLVAALDLSSRVVAGNIALGTGFYVADEIDGESSTYTDFGIYPLDAIHGPTNGELVHVLDDLIKLEPANVNTRNFYARATFINPFAATESNFDYGLSLRADASFKYWLVTASEGNWELVERPGSADDDFTVNEGRLDNFNLEAAGRNEIAAVVWNEVGYFFLNDQFISALDVSGLTASGDIEVFTAFYFDHEIEGRATGYEEFVIWPLP